MLDCPAGQLIMFDQSRKPIKQCRIDWRPGDTNCKRPRFSQSLSPIIASLESKDDRRHGELAAGHGRKHGLAIICSRAYCAAANRRTQTGTRERPVSLHAQTYPVPTEIRSVHFRSYTNRFRHTPPNSPEINFANLVNVVEIDVETTAVWPDLDRIVELAMVELGPAGADWAFRSLLNPGRTTPRAGAAVHGISDHQVAGAPGYCNLTQRSSNCCWAKSCLPITSHPTWGFCGPKCRGRAIECQPNMAWVPSESREVLADRVNPPTRLCLSPIRNHD